MLVSMFNNVYGKGEWGAVQWDNICIIEKKKTEELISPPVYDIHIRHPCLKVGGLTFRLFDARLMTVT